MLKVEVVRMTIPKHIHPKRLQMDFLDELNNIVANGGQIISIVNDDTRLKKAYVIKRIDKLNQIT